MGISVGFGVIFAWLATYMLIGPILSLMSQAQIENKNIDQKIIVKDKTKKFIGSIFRYRFIILIFTVISVTISSFVALKNLQVNLDPYTQFPKDYKFVQDIRTIEKSMGPTDNIDFMIKAGGIESAKDPIFLKNVEIYQNWLLNQDYIDSTFSVIDILKDINKTLNNNDENFYKIPGDKETIGQELLFYSLGLPPGKELTNQISLKQDYIHLSANWTVMNSKEAKEKMIIMQDKAQELNLDSVITGKMPLFHELTPYVVTSFTNSFVMALIFITIILIIVLKSFKLGLLALVPNLYPLIIGSLFYTIFGWYIDMASVIIASVCLGIAVDDSIHFLFEYKKYKSEGLTPIESLEIIFTNTVPSLVNTTILLVIGFGSFYIADYVPNSNFGVMVAIVLTVALFADLIILPAILLISEKRVNHD
jgi:predicted RND superfamily exporter protein